MTRDQFIAGLREAADFFEAHPELPHMELPSQFDVFVDTKEQLAAIARMGGWNKNARGEYFWLSRKIGVLDYHINIQRARICRRVVVGSEVQPEKIVDKVEWVCDEPVLAVNGSK